MKRVYPIWLDSIGFGLANHINNYIPRYPIPPGLTGLFVYSQGLEWFTELVTVLRTLFDPRRTNHKEALMVQFVKRSIQYRGIKPASSKPE